LQNINTTIIFFITLLTLYHYYIHNVLEKMFSQAYFDYNDVKRPLLNCSNKDKSSRLSCIGMPSGHAETISVLCFLLYFYKIIPLWVCILFIFVICIQRITTNMHTPIQVVTGSILGLLYALIYKNFSYGFLIVFFIGVILFLLSVYKNDGKLNKLIPDWLDRKMHNNNIERNENSQT
jgi:membrane-associated phospholipid phosphatase